MQAYSNPKRESDPYALPDVEVFYHKHGYVNGEMVKRCEDPCCEPDGECGGPGWYWWTCLPGCLPDSDPIGPFATQEAALADAQQDAEEEC